MIDRCRAVLRAFAGLELTEARVEDHAVLLAFGPGGERWMFLYEQHLVVAGGDGAPPERFPRTYAGRFRGPVRAAAQRRVRTLLGRRLSSIEHGRDQRLTLRFAGGGGIRTVPRVLPPDWYVDDEPRRLQVAGLVLRDRTRHPEREVVLWDDDGIRRTERGGVVAGGGAPAASVVDGLAGLPLTGRDRRDLLFGDVLRVDEDGDRFAQRSVRPGESAIAVERPGGGAPWVRGHDESYTAAELDAALAPLIGSPVETARRDDDGLEIRFAGGGRLALDGVTDDDHAWSAYDDGARSGVVALLDGSLAPHDAYMNKRLPAETGVWGTLGVLRAARYRPPRPLAPPRAAPRSVVAGALGGLAGRRLTSVVSAGRHGLVLRFAPRVRVTAESCHVTVDDGARRERHHRRDNGAFGDRRAAAAALRALAGRTVEAVALDDGTALTLALSGGVHVVLEPNAWDRVAWWVHDRATGRLVSGLSEHARGGPDAGTARLRLEGASTPRPAVAGALGAIGAPAGDPRDPDPLVAARATLATLHGLPLTAAHGVRLVFGTPSRDARWVTVVAAEGDLRLGDRVVGYRDREAEWRPCSARGWSRSRTESAASWSSACRTGTG